MNNYEFGAALYRTRGEMLESMVYRWLSADGGNKLADIFAETETNDKSLADEMIKAEWGDKQIAEHGISRDEILEVIADLREEYSASESDEAVEINDGNRSEVIDAVKQAILRASSDADEEADTFSLSIRFDEGEWSAKAAFHSGKASFAADGSLTVLCDGDRDQVAKLLAGDEGAIVEIVAGYDDDWIEILVPQENGYEWVQQSQASEVD